MKLPNRYGTVTRLKGNRRRPWIVKEGLSGRQRVIGYAETKEKALQLLADYNRTPWDLQADRLTLGDLFELFKQKKMLKLGRSNQSNLTCAYRHCESLSHVKYKDLKAFHMQDTIDNCGYGYSTQATIKNLWRHLDAFAFEMDIISKKYSDLLTSASVPATTREVFTDEEVARLWENERENWVDTVLFLLYTGFRVSEMFNLRLENIDLAAGTMQGGTKTDAGKNRIVPIHSKIRHIVEHRAATSTSGYLFEYKERALNHSAYRYIWAKTMNRVGMTHTAHECRHTFRSWLDSAGANKVCIDRLMGHVSAGTGERVYTHKTIEELKSAIELITN